MKTRHMTNMDQKIDELKSYIEELFCSRDKKLENYMKIYSKSFGKKLNYNSQMNWKNKTKE